LAERRETAAVANYDLRRGEVERGPSRGISGRENHLRFLVHKAMAKLTVAETTAEARQG
jgi:hypothetical protein